MAQAQAFVDHVASEYSDHMRSDFGDLPELMHPWAFAATVGGGSSLVADHHTPQSIRKAMQSTDRKEWCKALQSELLGMKKHKAWEVIKKGSAAFPHDVPIMGSQMVFKIKADKHGRITKFKVRLVARGDSQVEGVNYDDTFSPVVRMDTVRMFFAQAAQRRRKVKQIDFEAAFLQAELPQEQPIYMKLPPQVYEYAAEIGVGADVIGEPGDVLVLRRSLYGLKQAGLLWNGVVRSDLEAQELHPALEVDECLYRYRGNDGFQMWLLLYVDDCIYFSNDDARAERIVDAIERGGRVLERLGDASWFLGISVEQNTEAGRIVLTQSSLAREVLQDNGLFGNMAQDGARPASTPCSNAKDVDDSASHRGEVPPTAKHRHKLYRTVIGKLLYLARITRPDICFAVSRLGRFAANPGERHFRELAHLLRYLSSTVELGLAYHHSHQPDFFINSNSFGASEKFDLLLPFVWSDSDWAGEATSRVSTSGFAITFAGAAIAFGSERQACIALSTTEAELVALARAVQECIFVRKLAQEFMGELEQPTFVFCDNKGALDLVKNNVFHKRTKHIDIKYFFARSKEADGTVVTARVPTEHNLSDSFTKGVNEKVLLAHRFSLHGMRLDSSGARVFSRP